MHDGRKKRLGILLAATALALPGVFAPQLANAETPREAELATRLQKLEAEMAQLRADLAATRDQGAQAANAAQAATAKSEQAVAKVAALEAKPAPTPPDGFRAGPTTIKLGGYIKLWAGSTRYSDGEVATNSLGRDFYLPQAVPTGGAPASRVTDFTAKQSRFWLNFATDVAGHAVKAYLETDFQTSPGTQGSQRTTNGYNLALRRAYLQLDRWTFGQDWSTFQYTGALPESTDYVGGAEGTVFVRQPLIRYTAPIGTGTSLMLSVENPESGTANLGSPTLIENGDDAMPDFTARLVHTGKRSEVSLAGLVRQVRVNNAGGTATTVGYGVSLGGKLFLNDAKTGDVRLMATYGHNAGRYIGLNFAPDAVFNAATNTLESVKEFAAIGALRLPVATNVRVNLMGSYQKVDYSDNIALISLSSFNKEAWSVAGNVFYSPIKNVDLGLEVRHGERTLMNGADGSTDRVEVAAKYSF